MRRRMLAAHGEREPIAVHQSHLSVLSVSSEVKMPPHFRIAARTPQLYARPMRMLPLLFLAAAVCTAAVTPPDQIKVPVGFKVELLREAGPGEGSWICMTQDNAGRLYISSQAASFAKDGQWDGIWRVTLGDVTTNDAQGAKGAKESGVRSQGSEVSKSATGVQSEKISNQQSAISNPARTGGIQNPKSIIQNFERVQVPVSDAMGMLWAFDSLYVSGNGPQGRGIYRCTSSTHRRGKRTKPRLASWSLMTSRRIPWASACAAGCAPV